MKIGIIGCGKRFVNVYFPILKILNHRVYLWNRTSEKSIEFCKNHECNLVEKIDDFSKIDPDLILCFVPPGYQFELLKNIPEGKCKVLLETPAEDQRLILNPRIGVLEQWPLLPLEQFKEKIYNENLIERPYMVFNDGRSFDYHAIAQLRSYVDFSIPKFSKGTVKTYENPGQLDCNLKINTTPHEWTIGQIEMSNGSILLHNFSYNCKSLLTIPIQFIRCYSSNGSIVTGRTKEIGNDYEVIDIRAVDKNTKKSRICQVNLNRSNNTTQSISVEGISWNNPYQKLNFDDQQTAIATLIENGINQKIYSYKNAYIDNVCMQSIKHSGYRQEVIKLI